MRFGYINFGVMVLIGYGMAFGDRSHQTVGAWLFGINAFFVLAALLMRDFGDDR